MMKLELSPRTNNHRKSTAAQIPKAIIKKKITNSNDERTGFLKRTIESAPIIPKESAIFPDITLVIEYVIIGSSNKVMLPEKVLIQFC